MDEYINQLIQNQLTKKLSSQLIKLKESFMLDQNNRLIINIITLLIILFIGTVVSNIFTNSFKQERSYSNAQNTTTIEETPSNIDRPEEENLYIYDSEQYVDDIVDDLTSSEEEANIIPRIAFIIDDLGYEKEIAEKQKQLSMERLRSEKNLARIAKVKALISEKCKFTKVHRIDKPDEETDIDDILFAMGFKTLEQAFEEKDGFYSDKEIEEILKRYALDVFAKDHPDIQYYRKLFSQPPKPDLSRLLDLPKKPFSFF